MPLLQRFICTTRTVTAGPHEEGGAWPLQAATDRTDAAHQAATDRGRRRDLPRTKRSGICEKTLPTAYRLGSVAAGGRGQAGHRRLQALDELVIAAAEGGNPGRYRAGPVMSAEIDHLRARRRLGTVGLALHPLPDRGDGV